MTDAIRSCPFCGGEPNVICNGPSVEQMQYADAWGEDYDVSYYVQCLGCTATSTETAERSAAIAAWNRRAGDEREQQLEAALAFYRDAWDQDRPTADLVCDAGAVARAALAGQTEP